MAVRQIRLWGDPVLRTRCEPVTSFDRQLRDLVTDLMDTVRGGPGRAAVAAPQIGVSLQVFAYDLEGMAGHVVNPTLECSDDIDVADEGCLSLPGLAFATPRAAIATVRGFDQHGEPLQITGRGMLARAFQHETDHLQGRLYVDTLRGDIRRQALRAVRAAPWAHR